MFSITYHLRLIDAGAYLNDLHGIPIPKEITWTTRESNRPNSTFSLAGFLFLYDWDILVLPPASSFLLSFPLILCTGIIPCAFTIKTQGDPQVVIPRTGNGQIICSSTDGCESLSLKGLYFSCADKVLHQGALLNFSGGTSLNIDNSSFSSCLSNEDGGVILSNEANVTISASVFMSAGSLGRGGAISVTNGFLFVSNSSFVDCTATKGGGCVSASGSSAYASIQNSSFIRCTTQNDGGAVLSYNGATMHVVSSVLHQSIAFGSGGAICAMGSNLSIFGSSFDSCSAQDGGGVYSGGMQCYAQESLQTFLQIERCVFDRGTAAGSGGAIVAASSSLQAIINRSRILSCNASLGGGAAMLDRVQTNLFDTDFVSCLSLLYGGGVYADGASILAQDCLFDSCLSRVAGGAVYSLNSMVTNVNSTYVGNSAVEGGGGAIFLAGIIRSNVSTSWSTSPACPNSNRFQPGFCCKDNHAIYGPCIASNYDHLSVSGMPAAKNFSFPGIAFNIEVTKHDFFNQIIASDSTSVLETFSATSEEFTTSASDPAVSVSGVARLESGRASLSILIRPLTSVHTKGNNGGIIWWAARSLIYLKGVDLEGREPGQLATQMYSHHYLIDYGNDSSICPQGYILVLDASNFGSCTYCLAGTYSLNPLTGKSAGQLPSCLNCPMNANCYGGSNVEFFLGTWTPINGIYTLVGCPKGTALDKSGFGSQEFNPDLQECSACGLNEYIIDPLIPPCVNCPVGATCSGGI